MTPSHLGPVRAYFLVLASMVSAGRFCGVCTGHGIQRGRPVMAVPHLTPPHTTSHHLTPPHHSSLGLVILQLFEVLDVVVSIILWTWTAKALNEWTLASIPSLSPPLPSHQGDMGG